MKCNQCGNVNQSGKFCVKCGASLETAAAAAPGDAGFPVAAPRQPQESPHTYAQPAPPQGPFNQPNPQLQQAKQAANQFANLFVQALKRPLRVSEQTASDQMVSGIISMVLFALLAPLVIYFELRTLMGDDASEIPFGKTVLQPFVMLLIVLAVANVLILFALKLGNVSRGIKEIVARLGAYTIPSVAVLAASFLLALMGANLTFVFSLFGVAFFAWIVAIGSTVYSYKQAHTGGLDPFYGVLLTLAATFFAVYLFRGVLLEGLLYGLKLVAMKVIFGGFFGMDGGSGGGLDGLDELFGMFDE